MPPGTRDLLILILVVGAAFMVLLLVGVVRTVWEDRPARRARREWKHHCDQAMRLVNDATWPSDFGLDRQVTRSSIKAAHEQELAEGSRQRHPAFRNRSEQ